VMAVSCGFVMRDSDLPLERARARVLLGGLVLAPVLPSVAFVGGNQSGVVAAYFAMSSLVLPFATGYAISRYDLFSLELDVRRAVARTLYFGLGALALSSVFGLAVGAESVGGIAPLLFLSFVSVVAVEWFRGPMLGFLETLVVPDASRLRSAREQLVRDINELQEADSVATLLGETIEQALRPTGVCVFLFSANEWRPSFVRGEGHLGEIALATDALAEMGEARTFHRGDRVRLARADIELINRIALTDEVLGLVVLDTSDTDAPYSPSEVEFVAMACEHAAMSLNNARLARGLQVSERNATTGRVAVALAHDVGKELDWIGNLARRLPTRLSDTVRVERDLGTITSLAEGMARDLRSFMSDALENRREDSSLIDVHALVDRAVATVSRIQATSGISWTVPGELRQVHLHENVERALANVIDNAVLVGAEDPVVVSAQHVGTSVELVVTDRGEGMSPDVARKAFRLGFTTRLEGDGSGVGLSVANEVIVALGGSISLESEPGVGTRVTIVVPVAEPQDEENAVGSADAYADY
jgi:signal transduction histidine kinase